MKTLVDITGDVRRVLQSSHLTARSTCLAMKPLIYATEKRSMSTSFNSHCICSAIWQPLRPSWKVSLPWLVDGFCGEARDSLRKECRLTRFSVSSPSHFALCRPVYPRPLMILVFRASTNCPTFGLLFESKCKRITPNVFSRGSWFKMWVSRYSKPALFNVLYTCWTAPISIIHPFCDGVSFLKAVYHS